MVEEVVEWVQPVQGSGLQEGLVVGVEGVLVEMVVVVGQEVVQVLGEEVQGR